MYCIKNQFPLSVVSYLPYIVTNPVSNLQGTRLNSTSIFLSWTAPPSLGGGQGYEIHTKFANTSTQSVKVHTTTDTSTVVTHSIKDVTSYEIFVVAFGGNLPSLPISLATITTLAGKECIFNRYHSDVNIVFR